MTEERLAKIEAKLNDDRYMPGAFYADAQDLLAEVRRLNGALALAKKIIDSFIPPEARGDQKRESPMADCGDESVPEMG